MTQGADYTVSFNAIDNISSVVRRTVRNTENARKVLTAGGRELGGVLSIGEGAGRPFVNATRHAQVYQTQMEQLVGLGREFNQSAIEGGRIFNQSGNQTVVSIKEQSQSLKELQGRLTDVAKAVQADAQEKMDLYAEAIFSSKKFQTELNEEAKLLAKNKNLALDASGNLRYAKGAKSKKGDKSLGGQFVKPEIKAAFDQELMQITQQKVLGRSLEDAALDLTSGAYSPEQAAQQFGIDPVDLDDFGQGLPMEELNAFRQHVKKLNKELLDLQLTGKVSATKLKDIGTRLDGLTQTALKFESVDVDGEFKALHLTLEGLEEELTVDSQGFREMAASIDAATFAAKELANEHARVGKEEEAAIKKRKADFDKVVGGYRRGHQKQADKFERQGQALDRKKLNQAERAYESLNREIRTNVNEARRNIEVWKELGVNAGLSTRRILDLEHKLKQLSAQQTDVIQKSQAQGSVLRLTSTSFEHQTHEINELAAAQQMLGGQVAQTSNRMAFMQDSNIKVQNGMRKLSSGMQGAMTAMSLMNGDVMGLAFSLIFLQFSGALKASAAFAVLTVAIMGSMKLFKKYREENKKIKDGEKVFATLTGSATGYALALANAEKMSAGLLLRGKDEEEMTKALVQAQLQLRKARLDATPQRLKVAASAFLVGKGYGMEFDDAVQAALQTVVGFSEDGEVAFDGVALSLKNLTEQADNYLAHSRSAAESVRHTAGPERDTLTVSDIATAYEMAGIKIPEALEKIRLADPTQGLETHEGWDRSLNEEILAPWNEVFGEKDGKLIKSWDNWVDSFQENVSNLGGEMDIAFAPFITEIQAMPEKWLLGDNATREFNDLKAAINQGKIDSEGELQTMKTDLERVIQQMNISIDIEGSNLTDELREARDIWRDIVDEIESMKQKPQVRIQAVPDIEDFYRSTGLTGGFRQGQDRSSVMAMNTNAVYPEMGSTGGYSYYNPNRNVTQNANVNVAINIDGGRGLEGQELARILRNELQDNSIFDVFPDGTV